MRTGMRAFLQRHVLVAFFLIAFLLSWYPWIIALSRGQTTGPNPLGPFVAAIIMTAIVYGRAGLREFFSRFVRWRVGAKNYWIVVMTPILICMIAAGITILVAEPHPSALTIEKLREVPERFLFIFLFIGLGEEPGWRGFALPELQKKIFAPVGEFHSCSDLGDLASAAYGERISIADRSGFFAVAVRRHFHVDMDF